MPILEVNAPNVGIDLLNQNSITAGRYRTYPEDYCVKDSNTSAEAVFIDNLRIRRLFLWR